jgi:hypothetical protein
MLIVPSHFLCQSKSHSLEENFFGNSRRNKVVREKNQWLSKEVVGLSSSKKERNQRNV